MQVSDEVTGLLMCCCMSNCAMWQWSQVYFMWQVYFMYTTLACGMSSICSELMQVSDQVTGQLEVRASSDEAAQAGQDIIEGFLNDPEVGTIYRSVLKQQLS